MTQMEASKKNYFRFFIGLVACLFFRLIPFRAPNVEPIMATVMPIGRVFGALAGSTFAVLSILLYDVVTHTLGVQTFFTVIAYGIVGFWSVHYFKKSKADKWGYVRFAIMGTLFFDAMTGLTVGPLIFHQSFMGALLGQIPFTALHLVGNVVLAYMLSPAIYHFMIRKKIKKENTQLIKNFNPKTI
jgi:uncharacterized membrane protein YuzA (DUF378 family)